MFNKLKSLIKATQGTSKPTGMPNGKLEKIRDSVNQLPSHSGNKKIPQADLNDLIQEAVHFHQSGQLAEATLRYQQLLTLSPDHPQLLASLGTVLLQQGNLAKGIDLLRASIKIAPRQPMTHFNLARALINLANFEEALASFNRVIELEPNFADAYYNKGLTLKDLDRKEEALKSFAIAAKLKPNFADAHNNLGSILTELRQYPEALSSYNKALKLVPTYEFIYGSRIHTKMAMCKWNNVDQEKSLIEKKISNGEKASFPLHILGIFDSPILQKKAAEIWVANRHPVNNSLGDTGKYSRHKKIRIGYFSADFCDHPVSYLMAELFERHDKSKFELIAFSFGVDSNDEIRLRIKKSFDRFIDASSLSDVAVTKLSREMEVDIAINLGGHTSGSRTGVFALRAAPIQVNYLGYPGTMGADYMDYIIADKMTIPEEYKQHYTEKIAYLKCFQANDSTRKIADRQFSREELGLPRSAFVYCCFNNSHKITPSTFSGWMRILNQVEESVLFMLAESEVVETNLKNEAKKRGIDPVRLIFGRRLALPEYLSRYRVADLFLDTFPFNAGTTASDALWAGLPVLTLEGQSFAGRMAASLLKSVGLPELIAQNQDEYESMAVAYALNRDSLLELRERLAKNRLTYPLFDTKNFAIDIESAYQTMYERYRSGLKPDHLNI